MQVGPGLKSWWDYRTPTKNVGNFIMKQKVENRSVQSKGMDYLFFQFIPNFCSYLCTGSLSGLDEVNLMMGSTCSPGCNSTCPGSTVIDMDSVSEGNNCRSRVRGTRPWFLIGKWHVSDFPGPLMASCIGIAWRKIPNFVVPTLPINLKLSNSICMIPISFRDSSPDSFTNPFCAVSRGITQSHSYINTLCIY